MKYMTSSEIRRMWLDFFKSKGHMIEPGASLVPHNDPTLLWINSGVAALKKYFDGSAKPQNNRITNAQKSIRTNDIDNVGRTARHHTFFEMMGNFSIGDYFRDDVIPWAWELLTSDKYFGFKKDEIYITYHPTDLDTYNKWIEVGADPNKLVPCEHNFWEIGEGPCGPNTEMFIDRGEKYDPEGLGEKLIREDLDNDRYIEIWNIVFSQFNAKEGVERSQYKELPQKNIDTGAGLERLVCILQDGETNFDTDLFLPIIKEVEKLAKYPYSDKEYKMSYRVIADHIRTTTFALADGALFSNEGRGYVLRRILRRAVRYGKKLGINESFMYKLVPVVAEVMKDYYSYLFDKIDYVQKLVKIEEEKFQTTLKDGEELLRKVIESTKEEYISGEDAFKLYDTYGFPIELTEEIVKESNKLIDIKRFKELLLEQKERARASREKTNSMNRQSKDLLEYTEESKFIYDLGVIKTKIKALFVNGEKVDSIDEYGEVIFETTNFYAEMGGEVADTGYFIHNSDKISITNVNKAPNKQHLHTVELNGADMIKVGDEVELHLDEDRRKRISRAHSACHLLQSALKEVLGDHVSQAGSYVTDGVCRFDFTHFEKIKLDDLRKVERLVNEKIDASLESNIRELPIEEAKKLHATALFDEKYGDVVRVVSLGDYSTEFCGGCHVSNTNDIGMFIIDSEESISSGVRRIEARVGLGAYEFVNARRDMFESVCNDLQAKSVYEVETRLNTLKTQYADAKKELQELKNKLALSQVNDIINNAEVINGVRKMIVKLNDLDKDLPMQMVNELKSKNEPYFFFLFNVSKDKVSLLCSASMDLVKKGIHSGNLIKAVAQMLGGNGGGRPDVAQAGGKDVSKVDEAIKFVEASINL